MIEIGDAVPSLGITVMDATGALANGGAVTCLITLPDGTTNYPPVTLVSTGVYSAFYTAVQAGHPLVSWVITGANANIHNDSFDVEQLIGIVSLAEAKKHLRITRTDDDEKIRQCIIAASDACESSEGTGKAWRQRTIANELHTGGTNVIRLYKKPVLSIVSVTSTDGTVIAPATDLDLSPLTGMVYSVYGWLPYSGRRFNLSFTYTVGSLVVPPLVRDGVLEMTRHLYNIVKGGTGLPAQTQPDYSSTLSYLIPYRVASDWQAHAAADAG